MMAVRLAPLWAAAAAEHEALEETPHKLQIASKVSLIPLALVDQASSGLTAACMVEAAAAARSFSVTSIHLYQVDSEGLAAVGQEQVGPAQHPLLLG
jgi:hypothetical protein